MGMSVDGSERAIISEMNVVPLFQVVARVTDEMQAAPYRLSLC